MTFRKVCALLSCISRVLEMGPVLNKSPGAADRRELAGPRFRAEGGKAALSPTEDKDFLPSSV